MFIKKIQFHHAPDDGAPGGGDSEATNDGNTDEVVDEKSEAESFYEESKPEVEGQDEGKEEEKKEEEEQADEGKESEDESKDDEPKVDDFGYEKFEVKEGFEVTDEAKELFKKHELGQEASQELVDYGVKIQEQTIEAIAEAQEEAKEKQVQEWRSEIDDKYGKELPKAQEFIQKNTSENFVKFLADTGIGDHPEMVGFVLKVANAVSEDSMDVKPPSNPDPKPLSGPELLYGDKYDNV